MIGFKVARFSFMIIWFAYKISIENTCETFSSAKFFKLVSSLIAIHRIKLQQTLHASRTKFKTESSAWNITRHLFKRIHASLNSWNKFQITSCRNQCSLVNRERCEESPIRAKIPLSYHLRSILLPLEQILFASKLLSLFASSAQVVLKNQLMEGSRTSSKTKGFTVVSNYTRSRNTEISPELLGCK